MCKECVLGMLTHLPGIVIQQSGYFAAPRADSLYICSMALLPHIAVLPCTHARYATLPSRLFERGDRGKR
jgi:hypothetical protein